MTLPSDRFWENHVPCAGYIRPGGGGTEELKVGGCRPGIGLQLVTGVGLAIKVPRGYIENTTENSGKKMKTKLWRVVRPDGWCQ